MKNLQWHEFANAAVGRQAVVIGKGPSLDSWIAAGEPSAPDALRIGVNHACAAVRCDFGVTNEHGPLAMGPTCWFESLPRGKKDYQAPSWERSPWATHWFLHVHGWTLLDQTREQVIESRQLFNMHSSINPAIHLAWLMGCTRLLLVGVDLDVNGTAAVVDRPDTWPDRPANYRYHDGWLEKHGRILRRECDTLFPGAWSMYPRQ